MDKRSRSERWYGVPPARADDLPCTGPTSIRPDEPRRLAGPGDAAAHAVLTLAMTRTGFLPDGSRRAAARAAQRYSFGHKGGRAVR